MAYILTQKDIDDLANKGFDMNGVSEGAEAMPAEMQALGMSVDAPAPSYATMDMGEAGRGAPDDEQLSGYSIARGLGLDVDQAQGFQDFLQGGPTPLQSQTVEPRVEPPASSDMSDLTVPETTPTQAQAAPSAAMQSLISSSAYGSPISTDPFENLSKNQRMMLAFAAIKDAGMSLQGKEGTAFQSALGEFRQRADMERKRQIQQAELQARQQVLGSLGAGALAPDASPAEIDAHIAKLTGILATNPQMAPYVTAEVARLQPIRDKRIQEQQRQAESAERSMLLTPLVDRALDYINPQGAVDDKGNPVLNPDIANKLSRGYAAFSEDIDYQDFMGNINTIKSQFTFKNMIDLKQRGVTFGSLSTEELKQVADLIGTLDPANPLGTMRTLNRVRTMLNKDMGGEPSGGLRFDPETGKIIGG